MLCDIRCGLRSRRYDFNDGSIVGILRIGIQFFIPFAILCGTTDTKGSLFALDEFLASLGFPLVKLVPGSTKPTDHGAPSTTGLRTG